MSDSSVQRTCSECGCSLAGKPPQAKTCGPAHRSQRSRRIAKQKRDAGAAGHLPPHQAAVAQIVRNEAPDVAQDVIAEELRPIVRESLTEEVLQSIAKLIGLAPRVVELIAEDLESPDSTVRQKAYTLLAKYTFGHPAILKPEEDGAGQQLVVNFEIPRPDSAKAITVEAEEIQEDTQSCDMCQEDKPVSEFVDNSTRCRTCYDGLQAEARRMLEA